MTTDLHERARIALAVDADRETLARSVAEVIRSARAYRWVGIYDVTAEHVAMIAYAGPNPPAYPVFPVDRGLTGEAVRTAAPIVSNDVANDARYLTALDTTGSEMIVPVLDAAGTVVGTIDVESDRLGAFGDDDVRAVSACCAPVFRRLFARERS